MVLGFRCTGCGSDRSHDGGCSGCGKQVEAKDLYLRSMFVPGRDQPLRENPSRVTPGHVKPGRG